VTRTQRRQAVYLLIFLLVCFAISSYYFHLAGTNILPGDEPYRVQAVVPTAVSLAPAGDVKQAGVTIGRVSKIAERGHGTVLELELDDKHSPVFRDAQVLLRSKSIAGENYVEVTPGTPKAGEVPSGELLAPSAAGEATQIDELFSIFDETRRRDLQRALAGLGDGLRGEGEDLNRTLEAASALATEANPAFRTMADENRHVARLVDSFGRVAAAIGERREGVRQLTLQAKAAAEAVDDRDDKLRDFIAELPGFLRQARSTSNRLTTFSGGATPVVRDLRQATEALVPTVRDLLPAAREGQGLVTELARFSRAAVPALDKLAPFSAKASTFVPPLAAFLRQGNPMFAYIAPYFREVGTFFANDAASFQQTDALGHVARIVLPISRSNAAGVFTPEQDRELQRLAGALDTRGNNAYPAPGGAGGSESYTGTYPRLEADPPYTR
jgi:phospholipid/cholesterol/gamma-HCH transport system substrate-binding protein